MEEQKFLVQETGKEDRRMVRDFVVRQWGAEQMVVHGESFCLPEFPGFLVQEDGEITALLIYRQGGESWEILSLDSLRQNRGAASRMLFRSNKRRESRGVPP